MNQELENALNYDSLAHAEKISGKSYKDNDSVTMLGMVLMHDQRKTKDTLLLLNRDTNATRQTIPEFFEVLKDMGFSEVLKLVIEDTPDHFHIFWRSGLLITLDTYGGRSINSGKCYLNFVGPRDVVSGSNGLISDTDNNPIWYVDIDIREGLRHNLDRMSEKGEFLGHWRKQPFLWLLHYMDTKVEGYDYKAINAERIVMLPQEIQNAIKGE